MSKKVWFFLLILAVLSPLGLFIPHWLGAGDAWGEWPVEIVKEHVGFEPKAMKELSNSYSAPVPDYNFFGDDASLLEQAIAYIISALLGVGCILLITFGLQKIMKHRNDTTVSSSAQ
ncbi:MAG: hypothetical protein N2662_04870 [Bacteroidales bacterium]|nr:hypothetical protein [Bacteroidales bacterium]